MRLGLRVARQEQPRGRVSQPVRRREEDEEVIPLLGAEELERECEARRLEGAEIVDVLVETGAERRRIAPVRGERLPVALTQTEGVDAASLVDGEPRVHDDGSVALFLVEREVDEHRPFAFARQKLVVRGPAQVAPRAAGLKASPSRSIMKS